MRSELHLRRAARAVAAGGIIAYPTEGVYGLGCDPSNHQALQRLVALKGRDARKGFILIAAAEAQLRGLVIFPDEAVRKRVFATWPGPCTWILPRQINLDPLLSGGRSGLAVRVTAHPLAAALCRLTGPLVSTSANRSGRPPARDSLEVRAHLGRAVDVIVPGKVGSLTGPTEVRNALTGEVVRAAVVPPPDR
jgi:L-threonylcarbamoyladenylate synthase